MHDVPSTTCAQERNLGRRRDVAMVSNEEEADPKRPAVDWTPKSEGEATTVETDVGKVRSSDTEETEKIQTATSRKAWPQKTKVGRPGMQSWKLPNVERPSVPSEEHCNWERHASKRCSFNIPCEQAWQAQRRARCSYLPPSEKEVEDRRNRRRHSRTGRQKTGIDRPQLRIDTRRHVRLTFHPPPPRHRSMRCRKCGEKTDR